jgi:hypothetical protein
MVTLELTDEEFEVIRYAVATLLDDFPPQYAPALKTLIDKLVIELKKHAVN